MNKKELDSRIQIFENKFCVLLTATIKPISKTITVLRKDVKTREKDYLESLNLWLSKTNFPIVFCDNSGYDLSNIKKLSQLYPNRLEIIQFNLTDYSGGLDYGYGEYKIIERAMSDSEFVKNSENIIKVTGRIFIENIKLIIQNIDSNAFVNYVTHLRKDHCNHFVHTVLFVFKKPFFLYLKESESLLKTMNFENFFKKSITKARKDGYLVEKIKIFPKYVGVSGSKNKNYEELIARNFKDLILFRLNFVNNSIIAIYIGKIGLFLKSKTPFIYKILKPYFPDKK